MRNKYLLLLLLPILAVAGYWVYMWNLGFDTIELQRTTSYNQAGSIDKDKLRKATGQIAQSSTSESPAITPKPAKNMLNIATTQSPDHYHPMLGNSTSWHGTLMLLGQRPLYAYDADWKLRSYAMKNAVDDIKIRKNTDDNGNNIGTIITITIKDDLYWGDGVNVTSKDLTFGFDIVMDPRTGAIGHTRFADQFTKAEIIDDHSVDFYCKKDIEHITQTDMAELYLVPAHIERPVYKKNPTDYKKATLYEINPATPGLYFGPYVLSAFEQDASYHFTINPHWKGKQPDFTDIHVHILTELQVLRSNIVSGQIDYIIGEAGLELDQALQIQQTYPDQFDYIYQPALAYEHIEVNLTHPILKDKKLRQALLYGLDRAAIVDTLFESKQKVTNTNVHFLDTQVYTKDTAVYLFDPDKAKSMLDEAGWVINTATGIREKDGQKLAFKISTTTGNKTREDVQQIVQSYWKKLGVDLTIENYPAAQLFGTLIPQGDFDLALFTWTSSPQTLQYTRMHSSQIPTEANNYVGNNYHRWSHPEADDLMDKIMQTPNVADQAPYWHELQKIYAEELPGLPLYFRSVPSVKQKWFKGFRPTGHEYGSMLHAEEWYREE